MYRNWWTDVVLYQYKIPPALQTTDDPTGKLPEQSEFFVGNG